MKIKKFEKIYLGDIYDTVSDFENTKLGDELYQKVRKVTAEYYVHLQDYLLMNGFNLDDDEYEKFFGDYWIKLIDNLEDLDLDSIEHIGRDVKKYNL